MGNRQKKTRISAIAKEFRLPPASVLLVGREVGVGCTSGSSSVTGEQAARIRVRVSEDMQKMVLVSGRWQTLIECHLELEDSLRSRNAKRVFEIVESVNKSGHTRAFHLERLVAADLMSGANRLPDDAVSLFQGLGIPLLTHNWNRIVELCTNYGSDTSIESLCRVVPSDVMAESERVAFLLIQKFGDSHSISSAEKVFDSYYGNRKSSLLTALARCYALAGVRPPDISRFRSVGACSETEKMNSWLAIALHRSGDSTAALELLRTTGPTLQAFPLITRCSIAASLGSDELAEELQAIFLDLAPDEESIRLAYIRYGVVRMRNSGQPRTKTIVLMSEGFLSQLMSHRPPRAILGDLLRIDSNPGLALILAFAPKLLRMDQIDQFWLDGKATVPKSFNNDARVALGLRDRRIRETLKSP